MDTTVFPGRRPAALRARPAASRTASPLTTLPRGGNEDGAVGIAVEGRAESGAVRHDGLLQAFQVERAAMQIDVASIGLAADGDDVGAEARKSSGASW